MKTKAFWAAAVALILSGTAALAAERFEAKEIGVADGDTITVLFIEGATKTPRRIRISGIDAPEKAQAFGMVARETMGQMAFGKQAEVECRTTDRYGRSICLVRVDGIDVGLRLIESGLAWHYKRYAKTQLREEAASYAVAESVARVAKTGLWRDLETAGPPVPPWDWRKVKSSELVH